ncbi:MAG: hypothetical protein KY475_09285 [Planctomycetes bacterium]|nr:hypothetical protein [Planctomycetota bacterium]
MASSLSENDSRPHDAGTALRRPPIVTVIVVAHLGATACIILLTVLLLREGNALTRANQLPWAPVVGAQSSLIALGLGLGNGRFFPRLGLCLLGWLLVVVEIVAAHFFLAGLDLLWRFRFLWGEFRTLFVVTFNPGLCVAALLLLVRAITGPIVREHEAGEMRSQFSLRHMLAVTSLIAIALAAHRLAVAQGLVVRVDFTQVYLLDVPAQSCHILGAAGLALARPKWWRLVGASVLVLVPALMAYRYASVLIAAALLYHELVVVITLWSLRVTGYHFAPARQAQPASIP